ncbi:MAG: hypothetical protein SGPRY_012778, partial [Prymnesium sp.]
RLAVSAEAGSALVEQRDDLLSRFELSFNSLGSREMELSLEADARESLAALKARIAERLSCASDEIRLRKGSHKKSTALPAYRHIRINPQCTEYVYDRGYYVRVDRGKCAAYTVVHELRTFAIVQVGLTCTDALG